MTNEGQIEDRKRESPQEAEIRMRGEEDTLLQDLETLKTQGKITDADADAQIDLLNKKHDLERSTGVPFANNEDFEEYEILASPTSQENWFLPDPTGRFVQGKKYTHEGHEWIAMGVNPDDGDREFRRVGDDGGIEQFFVKEELILPSSTESKVELTLAAELIPETEHVPATSEPGAAIETVSLLINSETAERKGKFISIEERVLDAVKKYKEGDNLPSKELMEKYYGRKDTAEFLDAHSEAQNALKEVATENVEVITKNEKTSSTQRIGRIRISISEGVDMTGILKSIIKSPRNPEEQVEAQGLLNELSEKRKASRLKKANAAGPSLAVSAEDEGDLRFDADALARMEGEGSPFSWPKGVTGEAGAGEVQGENIEERKKSLAERILSGDFDMATLPEEQLAKFLTHKSEKIKKLSEAEIARRGDSTKIQGEDNAQREAVASPEEVISSPQLTLEAESFLASVDAGGVPAFTTNNLKRIARENSISYHPDMTPNDIVYAFREIKNKSDEPAESAQIVTSKTEKTEEESRHEELRMYRKRWEAKTDEEQKHFVEECMKLFPHGKEYAMKRTNGSIEHWTLAFINYFGKALMENNGNIKEVPLEEFYDLNKALVAAEESKQTKGVSETREDAADRMDKEDEVLLATQLAQGLDAETIKEQNRLQDERHNAEFEIGRPFADLAEYQEWLSGKQEAVSAVDEKSLGDPLGEVEAPESVLVTPTENAPAGIILEEKIESSVLKKFEEKFGISESALAGIEGFTALSAGQQLLVLQNLEQVTLQSVKNGAVEAQKEEWENKSIFGKILSARWVGSYGFVRTKEIETELLEKSRSGVEADPARAKMLKEHIANISALTCVAMEGPDVLVKKDGTLEIQYVSPKYLFDSEVITKAPENHDTLNKFNDAANVFATIPREWGYAPRDEKSKEENARYLAAKNAYEKARYSVLGLYVAQMRERGEEHPEKAAMLAMNSIDERMQLNQLFNAHPDAEQALANIEDQNATIEGLKDFWRDKGQYVALGSVIRIGATLIAGVTGGAGLVLAAGVGGVVGTLQGKSDAIKLIRERRIDRRMSEEDEREEVTMTDKDTGMPIMNQNGFPKSRKIKEFTDATFFADRIERLSTKLEETTNEEERELIENRIAKTTALMEEKFNNGLINFGGSSLEKDDARKGANIANRLSFIQAMGRGRTIEVVDPMKLKVEMSRLISEHQSEIEQVRKDEIILRASQAGMLRAGFAFAGGVIAGEVKDLIQGSSWFGGARSPGGVSANWVEGKIYRLPEVDPDAGVDKPVLDLPFSDGDESYRGFSSESVTRAMGSEQFFMKYLDGVKLSLGRIPSAEEMNLLMALSPDNEQIPADVLNALKSSKGPLTIDALRTLAKGHNLIENAPDALLETNTEVSSVSEVPSREDATPSSEGEQKVEATQGANATEVVSNSAKSYTVTKGDNLMNILKENIPELKGLIPFQQENVIENLIASGGLKEVGIIDADRIQVGQTIDIKKITELIEQKEIRGEKLINHAKHLTQVPATVAAPVSGTPVPEILPVTNSAPSTTALEEQSGFVRVANIKSNRLDGLSGAERAHVISEKWASAAGVGIRGNEHWSEVREVAALKIANESYNPKFQGTPGTIEAARHEIHGLINKARAMGFRPVPRETSGAYLERIAKELGTPMTNEQLVSRGRGIWEAVGSKITIRGYLRPLPSAETMLNNNILSGMEATKAGQEFLQAQRVIRLIQQNTGVVPVRNEGVGAYAERAIRIQLGKTPALHADELLRGKSNGSSAPLPSIETTPSLRAPKPGLLQA